MSVCCAHNTVLVEIWNYIFNEVKLWIWWYLIGGSIIVRLKFLLEQSCQTLRYEMFFFWSLWLIVLNYMKNLAYTYVVVVLNSIRCYYKALVRSDLSFLWKQADSLKRLFFLIKWCWTCWLSPEKRWILISVYTYYI